MANGANEEQPPSEAEQRIIRLVSQDFERHQKNRESLMANEGFAISMQQVVSGGLLLGTLSNWREIVAASGPVQVLGVVLVAGLGLIAAVIAAQLRHEYRMWDVKSNTSRMQGKAIESKVRQDRANRYLGWMRIAMWTSTIAICVAVAVMLVGAWLVAVWSTMPGK